MTPALLCGLIARPRYARAVDIQNVTLVVRGTSVLIRQFEVSVVDGVDRGKCAVSRSDELAIGTAETTISSSPTRRCRGTTARCASMRAGSRCATWAVAMARSWEMPTWCARTCHRSRVRIGQTTIAVEILDRDLTQPISSADRFGPIVGGSPAMRRLSSSAAAPSPRC